MAAQFAQVEFLLSTGSTCL